MTIFLLVRHATNDMVDKAIAGWMAGVHLNEEGKSQAAALAERLKHVPVAAIYSSPLERARETAEPIAKRMGLEIEVREEIGEIKFGDWTGQQLQDLNHLPKWQLFNTFRSGTRIPGGELMLETQARIVVELERLRELHPQQIIAVVTHGDVIRAAVAHYAGIHLDLFQRIEISPASLSIIAVNTDGPQILRLNDTGELNARILHVARSDRSEDDP